MKSRDNAPSSSLRVASMRLAKSPAASARVPLVSARTGASSQRASTNEKISAPIKIATPAIAALRVCACAKAMSVAPLICGIGPSRSLPMTLPSSVTGNSSASLGTCGLPATNAPPLSSRVSRAMRSIVCGGWPGGGPFGSLGAGGAPSGGGGRSKPPGCGPWKPWGSGSIRSTNWIGSSRRKFQSPCCAYAAARRVIDGNRRCLLTFVEVTDEAGPKCVLLPHGERQQRRAAEHSESQEVSELPQSHGRKRYGLGARAGETAAKQTPRISPQCLHQFYEMRD